MNYISLNMTIPERETDKRDILIALLDSLDYEGITETETGLIAYINQNNYNPEMLHRSMQLVNLKFDNLIIKEEIIKEQNWNRLWESNFEPVIVKGTCVVRAPFHTRFNDYKYVITIEPKMAFGTGHHETTSMMISEMLEMDFSDKVVLDMGCGTGILGILAAMRKAAKVVCIDNDPWSVKNTTENAQKNHVNLEIQQGSKEVIPDTYFDIILANINRNILVDQMPEYSSHLQVGGVLIISGILREDEEILVTAGHKNTMKILCRRYKHNWCTLKFMKI